MEAFLCVYLLLAVILGIMAYRKYSPKIDIVLSGRKYIVLLWYYKYSWDGDCKRTYTKLFEI